MSILMMKRSCCLSIKWINVVIIFFLWLGYAACLSKQTIPSEKFYRLSFNGTIHSSIETPFDVMIAVRNFKSDALYHERALLYSRTESPLEIRQYYYHNWIDSPPRLLQSQLIDYLQKVNLAKIIVPEGSRTRPDYIISGRIKRFDHILGAKRNQVQVSLELQVEKETSGRILLLKEYSETIDVSKKNLHAAVESFGIAVTKIYKTFSEDLEKMLKQQQGISGPGEFAPS